MIICPACRALWPHLPPQCCPACRMAVPAFCICGLVLPVFRPGGEALAQGARANA